MEKASTSSERTPLVQPTYVFESSLTRSYQKKLRHLQCVVCVAFIALLGIGLLVTVSYNLSNPFEDDDVTTTAAPVTTTPLNLSAIPVDYAPMLKLSWPLKGQPPATWAGDPPSTEQVEAAIDKGKKALKARKALEKLRKPLLGDSPAFRAQRAAATSKKVKPMADAGYAAEEATRELLKGKNSSSLKGGVGIGPLIGASFLEPKYCLQSPPPCQPSKYRSIDGTCNNLNNPYKWGVSNIPFRRVLQPDYGDGISTPRNSTSGSPLPSARDVSVTVHRPSYAHDVSFTVMLAVWGQFVDHDITATALSKGENSTSLSCCDTSQTPHPECFPVPLDVEDPFYQMYNLTCMEFVRSASAPTCNFGPRNQLNQATAFIDGSTVYSFSPEKAQNLKGTNGGLLRMLKVGKRELLPPSTDPNDGCNTVEMNAKGRYCFESGDDRANENLHLTTMHLIWARQHNRLAANLHKLNPQWSDETVYQEARKIVGAQMQHITYSEFLPAVLGNDVMWALNLSLEVDGHSDMYDPTVDPSIANHFSAAAFRFAHTLLPSLIHNVDANNGTVSYVHLHEILFNPFQLYLERGSKSSIRSAFTTPVHGVDPHVTDELSNHLFERPRELNSSELSSDKAKKPHPCGLDLVSLNIQRGRDHGLPAYPVWREHCGFPRPKTFDDLNNVFDGKSLSRISAIYGSVDDIDLYTGALAEDPRGRLLGPVLTCLLADQFLRLKVADRFWYETADHTVGFTLDQLREIRKTTLAGVICVNEELLDKAQPRVMEEASPTNPLIDCVDLPQLDVEAWKDPVDDTS